MMKRIAATEKTRERLRALIDGRLGTGADRSDLVRLAVQLIIEEVLEAEARDKLGRERYERVEGEPSGYRNGYRTGRLKTAEGSVRFSAPQLRDTAEPFVSAVRENLAGRTGALEDLAVELFARGLSTRGRCCARRAGNQRQAGRAYLATSRPKLRTNSVTRGPSKRC
jgi:putative transposase